MDGKLPISQAVEEFIKGASTESHQTGRSYRTGLNRFLTFLATKDVSPGDDVAVIELYYLREFSTWLSGYKNPKTGRRLSKNTRSLYLLATSLFIRRLIIDKRITHIDQRDYDNLRGDINTEFNHGPLEKKLPADDLIDAILELATVEPEIDQERSQRDQEQARLAWLRDRAIVYCLHSSGARVGELVNLVRGDLQERDSVAWVTGKGSKTRKVRFSEQAWTYLNTYLEKRKDNETGLSLSTLPIFCRHDRGAGSNRKPLSTRSVESLIADLAARTGLAKEFHMHPHSFRHYFATRFLRHTKDLALTQDVLGHSSPTTTRLYATPDEDEVKQAYKEMFDD